MTVTATPRAAPLTTNTSTRRRNSRFFIGAKNGTSARSAPFCSKPAVGRFREGAQDRIQARKSRTWISAASRTTGGGTDEGGHTNRGRGKKRGGGRKKKPPRPETPPG